MKIHLKRSKLLQSLDVWDIPSSPRDGACLKSRTRRNWHHKKQTSNWTRTTDNIHVNQCADSTVANVDHTAHTLYILKIRHLHRCAPFFRHCALLHEPKFKYWRICRFCFTSSASTGHCVCFDLALVFENGNGCQQGFKTEPAALVSSLHNDPPLLNIKAFPFSRATSPVSFSLRAEQEQKY